MRRHLLAPSLIVLSLVGVASLVGCSNDEPPSATPTTRSTAIPPPSTTPVQAPVTTSPGGKGRAQVVVQGFGSCLAKLGATTPVDFGDGRTVTSSIKNGAVTLRWSVNGTKAVVADEGTADFLGTVGC